MIVIVVDNAVNSLRGELTRWIIEVKPGVFVGKVSGLVREKLWKKVESTDHNGALMVYSDDTEQGFSMKMCGNPTRSIVDIDGIQLIKTIAK